MQGSMPAAYVGVCRRGMGVGNTCGLQHQLTVDLTAAVTPVHLTYLMFDLTPILLPV